MGEGENRGKSAEDYKIHCVLSHAEITVTDRCNYYQRNKGAWLCIIMTEASGEVWVGFIVFTGRQLLNHKSGETEKLKMTRKRNLISLEAALL